LAQARLENASIGSTLRSGHLSGGDFLRSVGLLAVISIHVAAPGVLAYGSIAQPNWWCYNILDGVSRWAVPVFLMLSGALLLGKAEPAKQFYAKRFARVGAPLLFWSLFYPLWRCALTGEMTIPSVLKRAAVGIATGVPYYHLHFLFVLAGLYLFAPVLRLFVQRAGERELLFFSVVALLAAVADNLVRALAPTLTHTATAFSLFVPYIGYFLLGYYLRGIRLQPRAVVVVLAVSVLTVSATVLGTGWLFRTTEAASRLFLYGYFSPTVVVTSMCVFLIANSSVIAAQAWLQRAARAVAPYSLGVYLVHPVFIDIAARFGIRSSQPDEWAGLSVLTVLAVCLCSVVAVAIMRKVPCLRMVVE
jgi:surface polysaccharide O-acyltransferase-like enzyme